MLLNCLHKRRRQVFMDTGIKVAGTGCLHAVLGVGFSFYLQKTKTRMLPMFETDFVATRSSSSSEEKNRVNFEDWFFCVRSNFRSMVFHCFLNGIDLHNIVKIPAQQSASKSLASHQILVCKDCVFSVPKPWCRII